MGAMSGTPVPIHDLLIHAEFVRGLAHALARDPQAGDDLLQDVWVAALRRPPRHGASLRGWLATLVGSLFANRTREERRRRAREASVPPLPDADPTVEIVAREQVRQRLLAAVLRLDEPFRTAVLLRYHEELSPKQIAARLSVPAATVRTRIARGLDRLRTELDREHGDRRAAWLVPLFSLPGVSTAAALPLLLTLLMKKSTLAAAALLLLVAGAALLLGPLSSPPAGEPLSGGGPELARPAAAPVATRSEAARVEAAPADLQRTAVDVSGADSGEPTGELLVTVVWADDTPAAGIHVYLGAEGELMRPLAERLSDARGQVLATVPHGKVAVQSDRGGEVTADVKRAERCEVRLSLPAGVDVVGVVRDAAGAAVADATIWLTSHQLPWSAMAPVASSDREGRFTVRSVPVQQSLGAMAAGHAPSPLVDLETCDIQQKPVRIELTLASGGGALFGQVRDPQGQPVANASIAVGSSARLQDNGIGNTTKERWAPARTRSDAAGNYRFDGLATGKHPVEVWAAGHPFWRGDVEIQTSAPTRLDIRLQQGVTVQGVVTGEDGAPLAGAIVRAYPIALAESYLMMGQHDYESVFGSVGAVADAEGRYRLLQVAPGELHLYANARQERRLDAVVPWAHEAMTAAAGAVVTWNPQVVPGPTIRGVARHRDGVPLSRHFVSAKLPGQERAHVVYTDPQGRFRFVCLQRQAYDISVQLWSQPEGSGPLEARAVWPDSGELELVTTYDGPKQQKGGNVRGVVVDAAGRATGKASMSVLLVNADRSWRTESVVDGKFRFTEVDPGAKHLVLLAADEPIHFGETFEVGPAEDKDVGALTTQVGGSLTLRIVREAGTEAMAPTLYVTAAAGSHGRKVELGTATELTVDNLCAGATRLSLWHAGMTEVSQQAVVVAGVATTATITLRAAVQRELVVEYGPEQRITRVRLADAAGQLQWDDNTQRSRERPHRLSPQLTLGTYTLIVETANGRVETTFTVSTLEPGQPPVVLQVK